MIARTICLAIAIAIPAPAFAAKATVVTCKFEHMPTMVMTFRGGMGASDNTVKIGKKRPVPLSVGSSMMLATVGAQELSFSLRLPASVTVSAPGNDSLTYYGECD